LANPDHARVVALALARARTTANAAAGPQPLDLASDLAQARAALRQAEQARADLLVGRGTYLGTEAGQAIPDIVQAARAGLAKGASERASTD
jgi:hypothetical protein